MGMKEDLAAAFGVEEDDPRLDQFVEKAVKKGFMPGQFAAFATGQTNEKPQKMDWGAEGAPQWLIPGKGGARKDGQYVPPQRGDQGQTFQRMPADELVRDLQQAKAREAARPTVGDRALSALDTAGHMVRNVADGFLPGDRTYSQLVGALPGATPEQLESWDRENPNKRELSRGTGMGLSALTGPDRLVAEGVSRGMARVAPELASRALGRVGVGAASGAISGAMKDPTLEGTATGAAGGLAGSAGAELASSTVAGARRLLHTAMPWVGRYAEASDAGLIEAAKKLPKSREGIEAASRQARDEIIARDAEMTDEAISRWQSRVDPLRSKKANMTPVRQGLLELGVESRPLSAEANHASERLVSAQDRARALADELEVMRAPGPRPPRRMVADKAAESAAAEAEIAQAARAMGTPATPTVARARKVLSDLRNDPEIGDLLQVRRSLDEGSGFGSASPTDAQMTTRKIRQAVRQGVRQSSPEVAAADDELTAFKRLQERRNDILFRTQDGGREVIVPEAMGDDAVEAASAEALKMRVADEMKAARVLGYHGDDSIPATQIQPYLDELAAQDPAFAAAIKRLEAKKALEATRFSTRPEVRSNITDVLANIPVVGAPAAAVAQYGRFGGRVLDQGALRPLQELAEGAKTVAAPAGANVIIEARRQEQQRRSRKAKGQR